MLGFATLLGEDGRAMHKSWGNAIEFNEGADKIGADVMRWMFANQRYDTDMLFGYHHADETRRRFFIPLWNVYSFFVTYANLDGWKPNGTGELSPLDRWIHARLHELIGEANAALSDYDLPRFAKAAEVFVDDLSNWYVRRSRAAASGSPMATRTSRPRIRRSMKCWSIWRRCSRRCCRSWPRRCIRIWCDRWTPMRRNRFITARIRRPLNS